MRSIATFNSVNYDCVTNSCLSSIFYNFLIAISASGKDCPNYPPLSKQLISTASSISRHHLLKKLVLKSHVRLRLKTNAGAEDVGEGSALLGKSVDNGSARGGQGSLEHVAEDTQDAVEALVLSGGSTIRRDSLPLDTRHHLRNNDQVDDQRGSKQGVLADVEEPKNC